MMIEIMIKNRKFRLNLNFPPKLKKLVNIKKFAQKNIWPKMEIMVENPMLRFKTKISVKNRCFVQKLKHYGQYQNFQYTIWPNRSFVNLKNDVIFYFIFVFLRTLSVFILF